MASVLSLQFANDETGQINPSRDTLADYLGLHPDTIKKALRELIQAGWLARQAGLGRGRNTLYQLMSPGRVVPLSSEKKGANSPSFSASEKGGKSSPLPSEKGGNFQGKGGQITPSHIMQEQSSEQRERARGKRPADHLNACVQPNSWKAQAWDEWLTARRYPTLAELGIKSSDASGVGWDVPFPTPPSPDIEIKNTIALRWVEWACCRMQERADDEEERHLA